MSDRRVVVAGVVVLGAAIAAFLYWTNDERRIRRVLDAVADAVSQEEGTGGVAGLAEVAGLNSYLAPDVALDPGEPFSTIVSAQDVVATVGRLRAVMTTVDLTFSDVQIAVDGSAASVRATAHLALKDRTGDDRIETRDTLIALEKRDGGWIITSARAVGAAPERG